MATRSDDGRGDGRDGRTGRQAVFEDVFEFLARARSGAHPNRMATVLLRRTVGSAELVALVDGGRRAVFHDARDGGLRAVPFDEHGLVEDEAATLEADGGPADWVAGNGEGVAWLHPRYRSDRDGERDGRPQPE